MPSPQDYEIAKHADDPNYCGYCYQRKGKKAKCSLELNDKTCTTKSIRCKVKTQEE